MIRHFRTCFKQQGISSVALIAALAVAVIGGSIWINQSRKAKREEVTRLEQVQAQVVAEADAKRLQHANDTVEKTSTALREIHSRWTDASRLAHSTARVSLSTPVASLQELQRTLRSLEVPGCLSAAKKHLSDAIGLDIESIMQFMVDSSVEGQTKATLLKTRSVEKSTEYATVVYSATVCS